MTDYKIIIYRIIMVEILLKIFKNNFIKGDI